MEETHTTDKRSAMIVPAQILYKAYLDVRFKFRLIKRLMKEHGLHYTDAYAKAIDHPRLKLYLNGCAYCNIFAREPYSKSIHACCPLYLHLESKYYNQLSCSCEGHPFNDIYEADHFESFQKLNDFIEFFEKRKPPKPEKPEKLS
jgi:hypothetical protein